MNKAVQITAIHLQKIDLYTERENVIREACEYKGIKKIGLRDLTITQHKAVQDWCKRYAQSHGILLEEKPKADQTNQTNIAKDRMRKKIISYAYQMQWVTQEGKADMPRLNNWCVKYGMFHKPLNDHNMPELVQLVTQVEKLYKSHLVELRKAIS